MIEQEFKVMLTKEQYEMIQNLFNWESIITQVNFYYSDLNGELRKSNTTVIVRELNRKLLLQVKLHLSSKGSLHIKQEYEKEIEAIPKDIDSKALCNLCNQNNMPNVTMIGHLVTERNIIFLPDEVELCIDKNIYLDEIDYELEIEYRNQVPVGLLNKFRKLGLNFDKDVKGKHGRFISKYSLTAEQKG